MRLKTVTAFHGSISLCTSVNHQVNLEIHVEMIHGHCLVCTIHWLVVLWSEFLDTYVLISKHNFLEACRRMTHSVKAAAQTVIANGAFTFIMLAFRGSSNPPTWCEFYEW